METRKRLIRTLVVSVFLHATETWKLKADNKRRIHAFELCGWRRMLKIPWTARSTNNSIVEELQEPVRLSIIREKHSMRYFEHIDLWTEGIKRT